MKLKQAMRASAWDANRRRSSNSHSKVAKKLSHMALSVGVADRPHGWPHAGLLAAVAERQRRYCDP